ncbi:MAG: redoxin domain-containing protein [Acidobacteriota bacterium]
MDAPKAAAVRGRRFARIGAAASILLALVAIPVAAGPPNAEGAPPDSKPAEPWRLEDIDGVTWTPAALDGKVVLLDFWATWCLPCIAEFPHLRRLDERFPDSDFILIGVALDAIDRRGLRAFMRRHRVDWPQVHEVRGVESPLAQRHAVEALPATVLLDRRGRPVARDLRGRALELAIESLIER